jgi:hypothetical protein
MKRAADVFMNEKNARLRHWEKLLLQRNQPAVEFTYNAEAQQTQKILCISAMQEPVSRRAHNIRRSIPSE